MSFCSTMFHIDVYMDDDSFIDITQNTNGKDCVIRVAPEQIDTLCEWLQLAKTEVISERETGRK